MAIFRSTDPTVFDDVDGIIIDESAPAPNIAGVAANVAILVAQFQRGPTTLSASLGSIGVFHEDYGKSSYSGNKQLKNKRFGILKVVRVVASDAVLAEETFDDGAATDIITFKAKQGKGVYGNGIKVTIEAGSSSGRKYTVQDTNTNAVLPTEVYDNIEIANVTAATFAASKLITATVLATSAEPAVAAATPLASGSDGTVADTDYETALAQAAIERAGNFVFFDVYTANRRGYLKTHAADTQDKMVILAPDDETTDRAGVVTDAGSYRDADGRIIYAFNSPQTTIVGADEWTSPASWMASILSQTSPHIDPAYSGNTQYLAGITDLYHKLTRADYIALAAAGVAAFEYDEDIGYKVRSGVVTQIANSSKIMIFRRRMADFLTNSVGVFLKNYQNGVNAYAKRQEVKGSMLAFIQEQETNEVLPKDSEVQTGLAKLVDTESLNTDTTIAAGFFKILYKQRIYSSMRFIVLQAEIGESVVVTEVEAA